MDVQLYTFKKQDKARESTSIYKYLPSPPPPPPPPTDRTRRKGKLSSSLFLVYFSHQNAIKKLFF